MASQSRVQHASFRQNLGAGNCMFLPGPVPLCVSSDKPLASLGLVLLAVPWEQCLW